MVDFPSRIKAAREAQGWSQQELARRLGVGQQAVSRWERGKATPSDATLGLMQTLLGLDHGRVSASTTPVGLPRLTELPFNILDEYEFESFSADLTSELSPEASVTRFGGRGEKQHGIDIRVVMPTGERVGIQCKRYAKFQPASFDAAVAELDPDSAAIDRCVLFLTVPASVKVQQRAAKLPTWEIWDADVLARKVRGLPRDAALRIVDRYFPGFREPFLGIRTPSPWETAAEAFDRFGQGDRYSHRWTLVGRSAELDALTRLAEAPTEESPLGLLIGAAGAGKSRLLKAVSQRLEEGAAMVVRIAPREPVGPEDFDLLPNDRKLVLIVDDAHEHGSGLRTLIAGVRRERPDAKILMATRPYGLPAVREALRNLGVDHSVVPTWTLTELSTTQAAALAAEALGSDMGNLATRLARAVGDCPLLLVVGAVQIRDGRLSTRLLETDEQIRREVADSFLHTATAGRVGDSSFLRGVLRAVSLLQPFRENVPSFQTALAALADQPFYELAPHLKALEDAGVLLRRGTSLRIVPDLLGDVVLSDAALMTSSGSSTGYLERAYAVIQEREPLLNALVNASRVDWQWRMDKPQTSSLVDPLWKVVTDAVQAAGPDEQMAYLPFLRQIGVFQPQRVSRLLHWLYESRPSPLVQRAMAPALEAVAHDLDYVDEASDLLWELGRNDPRTLNAHPDHALRILTQLASYEPGKAFAYQEAIIRAVARWLGSAAAQSVHSRMPLALLDPVFASEAESTIQEGWTLTIRRSAVNLDLVQNIRRQALDLLYSEYESTDPCRSAKAALSFEEVLRNSRGAGGSHVVTLLNELRDRTREIQPGPLASCAMRRAVSWDTTYGSAQGQEAAQEVIDALPASVSHEIAIALHSNWWTEVRRGDSGDYQAAGEAWDAKLHEIAMASATWTPERTWEQVESLLTQGFDVFGIGPENAHAFMDHLVDAQPGLAEVICTQVVQCPEPVQHAVLPAALRALLRETASDGVERARALVSIGQPSLARAVAIALTERRPGKKVAPDALLILSGELADHNDSVVRRLVIVAAATLSQTNHAAAVDLVTSVPIRGSADVAEEFARAVTIYRWLDWSDLAPDHASAVLAQLREVPELDGYDLQRLLSALSASHGDDVLELMMSRVEHWESALERLPTYTPLPFGWHVPLRFSDSSRRMEYLRRVQEWTAAVEAGSRAASRREHYAPEIFQAVAVTFDHEVQRLFVEWFRTGSPDQKRAAAILLQAAGNDLVWQEPAFVSEVLRTAASTSAEVLQLAGGSLHSSVTTGTRRGSPGEPYAEDVDIRDRAASIMATLEQGSVEERFYRSLKESAERMIAWAVRDDGAAPDHRTW
ncbi:XRE family transcriptional regulator [Streptomyces actuosus]|uniref:XRE family transcriptional regulator n=1 Tax=Streptomyces actuosus TaxID=1885 RepID=A0ABS2VXV3_STRAS|nr:helix-turn-helix domain-containing protein [Streptomyces actuosus]MBN0047987.1 XRE family transcriptional regulator [Streptomyces actuosus]